MFPTCYSPLKFPTENSVARVPSPVQSSSSGWPTQLTRLAADRMEQSLKKAGDARIHAISLGNIEYSGDLAKELMKFSSKLELASTSAFKTL